MGFMAIDTFANKYNASFKLETKFNAEVASVTISGNKAILIKPMTYMNLSGEAVAKVMNFYKISVEDILVISDDLDSTLGRVRLRASGSSGGHNGHKNIVAHIGTEEYKRIKIGIDRDKFIPVIDWVLKKLTKEELDTLAPSFEKASDAIYDFISGVDFYKIASKYSC
jgi:PTH1 family peptidyl-tRNA hydrolase